MKPLLIVDGYNVIGAWPDAEKNHWSFEESRDRLCHLLQDYAGYTGDEVVLVFDGYQSDRRLRTEEQAGPVKVVYTKHAETADSYIERLVAETPRYRQVCVATSDGLEQSQILSTGATRMTSRELLRELRQTRAAGLRTVSSRGLQAGRRLSDQLPPALMAELERLRREKE